MAPELTSEAWAQIRHDYEHTDRPVEEICAEHGISSGTLRDRMRRWHWRRRRPPIPREGPPAVAPPRSEIADTFRAAEPPTPRHGIEAPNAWPLGPRLRGDERDKQPPQPPPPADGFEAAPPAAPGDPIDAPAEGDAAQIVPRLQGAVVRVLPAIEATIAKLAAGPQRPRDMEQTARALGTLMRTLRELNALLSQHPLRSANDYDDIPEDIDEFRERLARRIEAFMQSRSDKEFDEDPPPEATPAKS
jgi:transposase-like protein